MIVYERGVKFTLNDNLCRKLMSQEIPDLKKLSQLTLFCLPTKISFFKRSFLISQCQFAYCKLYIESYFDETYFSVLQSAEGETTYLKIGEDNAAMSSSEGDGGRAGGVTVTLPSSQSSSVAQLRWVGVKSLTAADSSS